MSVPLPQPLPQLAPAVTARQREAPDDLAGWKQADPTTRSPEHDLVQRKDIARGLADLDDRTRETLLLLDQGYDQTEVAPAWAPPARPSR